MVQLPYRRPWFLEFHDQPWFPDPLRQHTQNLLTFLWVHRIPPFQSRAPYEAVADILERIVGEIEDEDVWYEGAKQGIRVVDCCSGAGGPMPAIERRVNARRKAKGQDPIPVLLSDLHPHPSAWQDHVAASSTGGLSYISKSVDALKAPFELKKDRHLRTFCLSFHHFQERGARRILEDAMRTAEGICIFELQYPDISSVITILALFPLSLLITPFTRPNILTILLTYIIPILPLVLVYDGLVSAWRTRTPSHIAHLANQAAMSVFVESGDRDPSGATDWKWDFGTSIHTWPTGRIHWAVGRRDRRASEGTDKGSFVSLTGN